MYIVPKRHFVYNKQCQGLTQTNFVSIVVVFSVVFDKRMAILWSVTIHFALEMPDFLNGTNTSSNIVIFRNI